MCHLCIAVRLSILKTAWAAGDRSSVVTSFGRRLEVKFRLFPTPMSLSGGQRLGIRGHGIVQARPGVMDLRVTPPTEIDRNPS
mgnify:CR=1 FL=1